MKYSKLTALFLLFCFLGASSWAESNGASVVDSERSYVLPVYGDGDVLPVPQNSKELREMYSFLLEDAGKRKERFKIPIVFREAIESSKLAMFTPESLIKRGVTISGSQINVPLPLESVRPSLFLDDYLKELEFTNYDQYRNQQVFDLRWGNINKDLDLSGDPIVLPVWGPIDSPAVDPAINSARIALLVGKRTTRALHVDVPGITVAQLHGSKWWILVLGKNIPDPDLVGSDSYSQGDPYVIDENETGAQLKDDEIELLRFWARC